MKNKGFTLVEMLAVIVILGIISGIALISVTRYRVEVDKKELTTLQSAFKSSYTNYRYDETVKGNEALEEISFDNIDENIYKYFNTLSYSGDHLNKKDLKGTKIKLIVLNTKCVYKTEVKKNSTTGKNEIVKTNECEKDASGNIIKENEEVICTKIVIKNDVKINDFETQGNPCKGKE